MKMDDMVSYLESKGFKASKKYISPAGHYEFHIEKDGNHMVSYFKYPGGAAWGQLNRAQEDFLDSLLDRFEREFESTRSRFDKLKNKFVAGVMVNSDIQKFASENGFDIRISTSENGYYKTIRVWRGVNESAKLLEYNSSNERIYETILNTIEELLMAEDGKEKKDVHNDIQNDLKQTKELVDMLRDKMGDPKFRIKKVIFNDPATIVLWSDGTKTVVKAENETFDEEKGLAMAISKKALGNKGNYYNTFTKWLPKEEAEVDGRTVSAFLNACGNLFGFASKTTACLKKENDVLYDKLDRADRCIIHIEDALKSKRLMRKDILKVIDEYWAEDKKDAN